MHRSESEGDNGGDADTHVTDHGDARSKSKSSAGDHLMLVEEDLLVEEEGEEEIECQEWGLLCKRPYPRSTK
jgi:hypothetical protein